MFYIVLTTVLILIDQLTKTASMKNLTHEGITLIDGILSLSYVRNSGAAWGMFSGKTFFLVAFTILVFLVGIVYFVKNPPRTNILKVSLALICSGGLGNMIDRIFKDGAVIDMIKVEFIEFPVFNVADICVCVGALLFCISILFFDKEREESNDE